MTHNGTYWTKTLVSQVATSAIVDNYDTLEEQTYGITVLKTDFSLEIEWMAAQGDPEDPAGTDAPIVFYPHDEEEEEEPDDSLGAKIKEIKDQIDELSGIQGIIRDVGTVGLTGIAVYILWLKRKMIMSLA